MSNVLKEAFTTLANAIRGQGITGKMTPLQMPTKVSQIQTTKDGISIACLYGDVDANGEYLTPLASFSFQNTEVTSLANYALLYAFRNTKITSFSLPNLTTVGYSGLSYVCYNATNLTSVNLSSLTTLQEGGISGAFSGCTSLQELNLNNLQNDSSQGLYGMCYNCTSLKKVYLKKYSVAGSASLAFTFNGCTSLELVDFSEATAVPAMSNQNCFGNTNNTFKIVVPDNLYSTWVAANNWSAYSSHIVKASEYST